MKSFTYPSLPLGFALASTGGAIGALLRWGITIGVGSAVWATLAINITGALALAVLPHAGVVRRHRWAPTFLGTGLLGGFTTMSGAALLLPEDRVMSLLAFVLTALIALPLVRFASSRVPQPEADEFEEEGGDE
jgi:CrcB protein